jgi:hypothetical protein
VSISWAAMDSDSMNASSISNRWQTGSFRSVLVRSDAPAGCESGAYHTIVR